MVTIDPSFQPAKVARWMPAPASNEQTKPTVPAARPDGKPPLGAGSGQDRTIVADLSPARPQPGPTAGNQAMTAVPGTDVQDAIPTHLSDPARKNAGTDVTNLHVGAGSPPSSDGTHLGEVWGDFQFSRLLGRGGMGSVYLGKQMSLDRQVAIKVLPGHLSENEQFRERFQLEAKAVAKMSSPHVVQVFAAGVHQGHHYFAMEFVDGEDLSRKLRTGYKPSYKQSLDLVLQAAKGLAAAGEHGIIHRDIKPGNMMIDRKGSLKIMDFGLVRLASAAHSLTMSGTVMGTVSYFSPEQGRGEPCDQRTDLYALGVVFYELLTGRLPFTGENATSVIYQHIHAPPKAPRELDPNIPDDFQAVVLKCMQKRADDRYASAVELISDLERLRGGQPPAIALERPDLLTSGATIIGSIRSLPPAGAAPGSPPTSRSSGPLAAAVVGVLAVGGVAAWWLMPAALPPPVLTAPAPAPVQRPPEPPPVVAPAAPATVPASPPSDPQVSAIAAALSQQDQQRLRDKERRDAIASAQALQVDGHYGEAEAALSALIASDPEDKELALALRKIQRDRQQAERQAAAAAAAAATTAAPPSAPIADPALNSAREALARGDLPEARRVVNVNRGLKSDDPAWAAMAKALDAAEGRLALGEAQDAFKRGNTEYAGTAAAKAKGLIPDDPELATLLADIELLDGQRKQRDRVLLEADNLLTEGQAGKAEELLLALAAQAPDDSQVSNALRRARAAREKSDALEKAVSEQLAQGGSALARNDLDAAQFAFTAALQLDPKNDPATLGLNTVRERKDAIEASRRRVEALVAERDLAAAAAELAELEKLAPGSPQAVLAASQLNAARVTEAQERAKAEALERDRQERAKALAAKLDDLALPIPPLIVELDAFVAEAGDARAELPDLRRRLDDRHSREAAVALLVALDAAFAKRDATALGAVFAGGPADGAQLVEFMAMPGARIACRLTGYARNGDTAVGSIVLVHAMDNAPEEQSTVRWEMRRTDGAWRIVNAVVAPAAAGSP
jgi:predicted Ser/Thr protein kinase